MAAIKFARLAAALGILMKIRRPPQNADIIRSQLPGIHEG
jgi:hypothetical protein